MLVCLGPFSGLSAGLRRTAFEAPLHALVPLRTVHLDNARIYAIYEVGNMYYVVYETDKLDFYRPYLAPLLPGKRIDGIKVPQCPDCGTFDVIVDADEMYCRKCDTEFWHYGVIWTPKPFDPASVAQGAGIYVVENAVWEYKAPAGRHVVHEIERIGEREERLGNILCKIITFYGYQYTSSYDEEPAASAVGVYERIIPVDFKIDSIPVRSVRGLREEELERFLPLLAERREWLVLKTILRKLPPEKGRALVKTYRLYEHFYWSDLEQFSDEEVKRLYVERRLRDLDAEVREALETLKRDDCVHYPGVAVGIIEELEKLGVQDPRLNELKAKLNYFFEEQEKKKKRIKQREEEERRQRRRKLEEVKRRLEEELRGLPVRVTVAEGELRVELTKRVSKELFQRYVETCRKHGLRFDGRGWVYHP